jgi:WD40 repeat protein
MPAGIAFSPDGKRLASACGSPSESRELKIWDALTGDELLTLEKVGFSGMAFSPDGHRLFSAGSEGLSLFDATPLPEKP